MPATTRSAGMPRCDVSLTDSTRSLAAEAGYLFVGDQFHTTRSVVFLKIGRHLRREEVLHETRFGENHKGVYAILGQHRGHFQPDEATAYDNRGFRVRRPGPDHFGIVQPAQVEDILQIVAGQIEGAYFGTGGDQQFLEADGITVVGVESLLL